MSVLRPYQSWYSNTLLIGSTFVILLPLSIANTITPVIQNPGVDIAIAILAIAFILAQMCQIIY